MQKYQHYFASLLRLFLFAVMSTSNDIASLSFSITGVSYLSLSLKGNELLIPKYLTLGNIFQNWLKTVF